MTDIGIPARRSIREIVLYFLRLGTIGFGGPVAHVGLMEKELVQERQWLTKVSNPLLIGATAIIGLIAFPLLQPDWVMVK